MKKVGLADWRTSNGLPSASDPETEADRTPRGSLLACMTANREPRLIKALKRQGGDGLATSRRFFPFCRRFQSGRVATAGGARTSGAVQCCALGNSYSPS